MSIRQDISLDAGIFEGDDQIVDWFIGTGPVIEVDAAAADGAISITVKPLKRAIASAAKVRFAAAGEAGIVATLSAAAKVGATTLAVTAISGYLVQGDRGYVCQDVTGWTLSCVVRLPPSTTALVTNTPTIQTAAEGAVRSTFTDTEIGTTLPAKSYAYRLRKTNDPSATLAYGAFEIRSF